MGSKRTNFKRLFLVGGGALLLAGIVAFLFIYMEGQAPDIELNMSSASLGKSQEIELRVSDRKRGISSVDVQVVKDNKVFDLYDKEYPGSRFGGGGLSKEETVAFRFDSEKLGISDGKGVLRVTARDYSWRKWWAGNTAVLEKEVLIDTVSPQIGILSKAHNIAQGGSGIVIYRLSEPCLKTGVKVGERFYPGYPGLNDDNLVYTAFFALHFEQGKDTPMEIQAIDYAGNANRAGFPHYIIAKKFQNDRIRISDNFLNWKMPEFEKAVEGYAEKSPVEAFLSVNKDLRRQNYEQLVSLTAKTEPALLWKGVFLRLPQSARKSSFADRRVYRYNGKDIDREVHLGIDLASVEMTPIPAANAGKILFAGPLGIYGQTVLIDHGFGLTSMYSHMSSFAVKEGQSVEKGDVIGRTGTSGLAGGDHLHFSMMVHDTFVNPVEWWDDHWIKDNVTSKINQFRK